MLERSYFYGTIPKNVLQEIIKENDFKTLVRFIHTDVFKDLLQEMLEPEMNMAYLEKMLYLVSMNVMKKWTQRYKNWDRVLNQLIIMFGGRLELYL